MSDEKDLKEEILEEETEETKISDEADTIY